MTYSEDSYAERALALLEKDILYLCRENWGYGMPKEDLAQELRLHLWNKLHQYHPGKAGLRTWAQQVMRRKLISIYRTWEYGRDTGIPRNLLDSPYRQHYDDLGDKEVSEEWSYEEIIITTFTQVA